MISRRPASADRANPLAIPFPHVDRSGVTSWTSCAPPVCHRNPRDVLVQDEQGSIRSDQLVQTLQVPLARWRRTLRLEDEARDLAGVTRQKLLDRGEIVVTEGQGQILDARRDAAAHGRRDHRPVVVREERVIDAERDEIATGEGARKLDCGGVCRRSVLRELHHVGAGDEAQERLGSLELEPRRAHKVGAVRELCGDRVDDGRIAVTERHGPQAHAELDVLVPVDVPHVAARPSFEDGCASFRELVDPLGVRVRAAGDERPEPRVEVERGSRDGRSDRAVSRSSTWVSRVPTASTIVRCPQIDQWRRHGRVARGFPTSGDLLRFCEEGIVGRTSVGQGVWRS